MSDQAPSAIIVSDGGLPAVVAAAIEAERAISGAGGAPPALMPWPTDPVLAPGQFTAAGSQARFYRLALLEAPRLCASDLAASPGLVETLALLGALEVARAVGAPRVVWPIQYHTDDQTIADRLDDIAAAADRALLVSRLSLLDFREEIRVETPLVDLTDRQVADLVVDLDAPAYLSWWWRRHPDPGAEAQAGAERRAWLVALREAGWVQGEPSVTVAAQDAPTPTPA
ncbi:MAG: hypothetical protein IT431_16100 [Phycisphaerales bacterium]|nr:hypothetical protein [Phycisphaerales bacterium]